MPGEGRSQPTVSIVAPIFNGGQHYADCFESLCRIDYPQDRLQVIVIDDASTDGTREYLQQQSPPPYVSILYPPHNLGRSAVRNFGLKAATGEIVILLDGDMEIGPDFVRAHVEQLSKPGRQAVLGSVKPAPWMKRTRLLRYLHEYRGRGARQFGDDGPIGFQYLLTHNLALTRAALEAGGPFDESFVHYGGEDTLLAYAIARAFPNGLYYTSEPTAAALHHHHRGLVRHLTDAYSYGRHNLPKIISRHPELATPLAADYAWPFPGGYFRRKRLAGGLMFNGLLYYFLRTLLLITPPPLSSSLIRYLTVGAVVRGLKRHVRGHRP
ncbi:MAG: glycosyltransferase family 2 protein [Candidatus Marinimicrobia bacterium]|nr:glycosyltransferase family 2 protein [Candidatus Neomarinimicrobiota bacterium]